MSDNAEIQKEDHDIQKIEKESHQQEPHTDILSCFLESITLNTCFDHQVNLVAE